MAQMKIRSILKNHDFHYECPPVNWESCIPLANGFIGAAIWGDGHPLKISLDKYDVWERRYALPDPRIFRFDALRELKRQGKKEELTAIMRKSSEECIKHSEPIVTRLPMGTLDINFSPEVPPLEGFLRLYDALFEGNILDAIVCSDRNVIVARFKKEEWFPTAIRFRGLYSRESFEHPDPLWVRDDWGNDPRQLKEWGYPLPDEWEEDDIHFFRQRYPEKQEYCVAWQWQASAGLLLVAMASTNERVQNAVDECKALLTRTTRQLWEELLTCHAPYWKRFWKKAAISIPDARLENLYYAELYKLACCSRPGSLPITLQGLWTLPTAMPPWGGDYHLDMNVQESYWPIYASNHLECGACLYDTFFNNRKIFMEQGRIFYNADVPLIACAMGPDGEPKHALSLNWMACSCSPGNGAWLSHLFWLHWLYSRDCEFLRNKAYPFMRDCMNVYLHIMEKDPQGTYHIPFSYTPEYFEGDPDKGWTDDNTYDIDLVIYLVQALLEAEKELGIPDPLHDQWLDVRDHLVNRPVDPGNRLMLAKGVHLEHSHRHHSHLLGLHPLGHLAGHADGEMKTIIHNTFVHLFREGTGEWTGWSFPWASLIAGRAGRLEAAHQYLQNYLDAFISDNSFHLNGDFKQKGFSSHRYKPMTLEAGFAAAAAILELLLRSDGGVIRVFPGAVYWPDATFENLRAEGAFLVSAQKQDGHVIGIRIYSEKGGLCRIEDPFAGNTVRDINMQPGEIHTLGIEPELDPVSKFDRRIHWFGVKKTPRF